MIPRFRQEQLVAAKLRMSLIRGVGGMLWNLTSLLMLTTSQSCQWCLLIWSTSLRFSYSQVSCTRQEPVPMGPCGFLTIIAAGLCGWSSFTIFSMIKELFLQWIQHFLVQTADLRKKHKYLLVIIDGFGAHIWYSVLKFIRDNNILAVILPSHTPHRSQALNYTFFSLFKNNVRKQ